MSGFHWLSLTSLPYVCFVLMGYTRDDDRAFTSFTWRGSQLFEFSYGYSLLLRTQACTSDWCGDICLEGAVTCSLI